MDFLRFFVYFCLIIFSIPGHSTKIADNLGIAFVHGTNDHRSATDNYWKADFIATLSEVLPRPENTLIVRCDFSHYMWDEDSAGCLADQLLEFIDNKQISRLIVYTHSDGGNVIRWILSNPTFDKRFMRLTPRIKQVIALAPSSAGTVLADEAISGNIFEKSLGWLLGYRTNSVRQQRVGDMAIFNQELMFGTQGRPSLAVPFRVIVGTDVVASPFTNSSYCNGYFLNAGLKLTKNYLDHCADGFLNCDSQAAAGKVWFYDWQVTQDNIPLSHNQSRHSCFGLDQRLRTDLVAQGVQQ